MKKYFDVVYLVRIIPDILTALPATMLMMAVSLVFGMALGFLLALARLRKKRIPDLLATGFISFIRGTPPLVQLFLVYYGLPQVLKLIGIDINDWSKVAFAIIAFSLNISAFLSEVMRSSYLAVSRGQQEAALSVGMTGMQAFGSIIFPQAFAIALPNLGNTTVLLLKETSLAFVIGITDIMGRAKLVSARGFGARQLEAFIAVALVYWGICVLMEKGMAYLEKRFKQGVREFA